MSGGTFLFVCIILGRLIVNYILAKNNPQKRKASKRSRPGGVNNHLILIIVLISFWSIFFLFFSTELSIALYRGDHDAISATIFLLLVATTVMQPALWARLTIQLGWVQAAHFLGYWARWINRRSPIGGGLFYGWLALQQHRNDAERYQAGLTFLQGCLDNLSEKMDGGTLLMQIILHRDEIAEDRFYRRLLTMGCLAPRIPPGLLRYAFRLLAAHALARGDWENLIKVTPEWRKDAFMWRDDYLMDRYQQWQYGEPEKRLDRFFDRLRYRHPRWEAQLPPVNSAANSVLTVTHLSGEALRQQSWALGNATVPEAVAQCWRQELDAPERLAVWQARAQQLGCRDVDAALIGLRQSVDAWLEYTAANATGVAIAATDVDYLFEKLRFQTRAIDHRQAQHQLMSGSEEFEEFLSLMELFDQLSGDPLQQHQAYVIFENVVWNWMAELWNRSKEKGLAYYICARLYPYASSIGSAAAEVYGKILHGNLR
jgi:hypothetical protein